MLQSFSRPTQAEDANPVIKPTQDKVKRRALGDISLNNVANTPSQKSSMKPGLIGVATKPAQTTVKFKIEEFHDPAEMFCPGITKVPDPYDAAASGHRQRKEVRKVSKADVKQRALVDETAACAKALDLSDDLNAMANSMFENF
jgi:hypothetical protein